MGYFDIEDALQSMLNSDGFDACAKPLPQSFSMPHVLVDLLNAGDANKAQGIYNVDFDCRAASYEDAAALQCAVADWVRALEGREIGGKPCYMLDSLRLQGARPDRANEGAIRAIVSAGLRVRIAD